MDTEAGFLGFQDGQKIIHRISGVDDIFYNDHRAAFHAGFVSPGWSETSPLELVPW